jgi:hypothetical protein
MVEIGEQDLKDESFFNKIIHATKAKREWWRG